MVKLLRDGGFQVEDEVLETLSKSPTVSKKRSALQYQVTKMGLVDESTKDALFGNMHLDYSQYKTYDNPVSGHKRVRIRIGKN